MFLIMGSNDGEEHQLTPEQVVQGDKEDNTSPSSSSSSASSPEFSFNVSLRPSNSSSDILPSSNGKTKSSLPLAVDLSPADDIFFHGHLLPLQILSHRSISPRHSTNSSDALSLPIKEPFDGKETQDRDKNCFCSEGYCTQEPFESAKSLKTHKDILCSNGDSTLHTSKDIVTRNNGTNPRFSFTLSNLLKWRKGSESNDGENNKKAVHQKKRPRFELSHVIRRCTKLIQQAALVTGKRNRAATSQFSREAYRSYSGNLSLRPNVNDSRGNTGKYSAPTSTRTSPTNSGLIVPTKRLSSSASDSSVEELQAAVEAAIAHCKKSFAIEENVI